MRTKSQSICAILMALIGAQSMVSAAEIRGSVTLAVTKAAAPSRYIVRAQLSQPSDQSGSLVAVCLEPLDATPLPTPVDAPLVMAQENTSFVPNLLVVPVGTKVTFPNHDAFFHNVFSYSPPRSFDLGRYPKGETRTVKFTEPGVVRIFCEIHASMYAAILVSPSDHYQIIQKGEQFAFSNITPGRYRIVALVASGRSAKTEIELKDGTPATVSLSLQ